MSILKHGAELPRSRPADPRRQTLGLLPERTRKALTRAGDEFCALPGQVVVRAGDSLRWVFIVLDGELVLRRAGRDQRILRAGSVYGALEAVGHSHPSAELVARDITRVLALPIRAYRGLAQTDSEFGYWVISSLAREIGLNEPLNIYPPA